MPKPPKFKSDSRPPPASDLYSLSNSEGQKLIRYSYAEKLLAILLFIFVFVLMNDAAQPSDYDKTFECRLSALTLVIRCAQLATTHRPQSFLNAVFAHREFIGVGFGVTICLALTSLIYTLHHAAKASKPYITYVCRKEVLEGGARWIARISNNGLGPAVNPISIYFIKFKGSMSDSPDLGMWVGHDAIHEYIYSHTKSEDFSIQTIGRGGVFSKEKELEIFNASIEIVKSIATLELLMMYKGHYGSWYQKTVVIVPPDRPARAMARL